MKSRQLPITKIDLDLLNPRHDISIDTQEKIISHLVDNDKVKILAKDIAENGISPIDLIAVIAKADGRYTVVEGNRRVCALTLLNKPNRSLTASKYFKRLKESSIKIPKEIECLVFENRADADIWIERKHSGEQEGKGTSAWDAEQKTRFNTRRGKTDINALAQTILDYSVKNGFYPEKDTKGILTTVTRYVSNPYFRSTFGIRSKSTNNKIILDVPIEQFNAAIKQFCEDLASGDKISSRHNSKQIVDYAKEYVNNNISPTTRVIEHTVEPETEALIIDLTTEIIPSKKDSAHPNTRKRLIPNTFSAQIKNDILRRIYGELKNIPINDQPLAAAMVCRVFLENIYEQFHSSNINAHNKMDVNSRISKIIEIIEKDKLLTKHQHNALAALRKIQSSTNNVLSPKVLGANVHGAFYPQPSELKTEWDNISEIVLYMLNKIYELTEVAKPK
jgi:hypothetical protein